MKPGARRFARRLAGNAATACTRPTQRIVKPVPLSIQTMPAAVVQWRSPSHSKDAAEADEYLIHVSASPPEATARRTADVCLVVDVSGSMGSAASIQTEVGVVDESHGLSVLDVVKHAMLTVSETLGEEDRLGLVTFDSTSETVLGLEPLTASGGMERMAEATRKLRPGGTTNLWGGLGEGLALLRDGGSQEDGRLASLLLLTDGMPNVVPPRGHEAMLQRFHADYGHIASASMFGFGYSLDSRLLASLAELGGGQYSFIPDAGFVGTTFVHALANMLSTAHMPCHLSIKEESGAKMLGVLGDGRIDMVPGGAQIPLASLQSGQSRDIILRAQLPPGGSLRVVLGIDTNAWPAETVTATSHCIGNDLLQQRAFEEQRCRVLLVERLAETLQLLESQCSPLALPLPHLHQEAEAWRIRLAEEIESGMRHYGESVLLTSMLADVNGQYREAISRPEWWVRWGRHYLRSLRWAHERQQCNNFKDASVQHYSSSLFRKLRDEADDKFLTLPPPMPSRSIGRAPGAQLASMALMHDSGRPCFHGDSGVRLADGSEKRLSDLRRGDLVATGCASRPSAALRCLVSTPCPGGTAQLVHLPGGGPLASPWHPVRFDPASSDSAPAVESWAFPAHLASVSTSPCDTVYSFVLDEGASILINGWRCLAWGHGIVDDPVAAHDFFGTHAVVAALQKLRGWEEGHVELQGVSRNPVTGLVCGFLSAESDAAPPREAPLRRRISCDAEDMQRLHERTGWTPAAAHVRPDTVTLVQKEVFLASLAQQWASPGDWVFHRIFDSEAMRCEGLRTAVRPRPGLVRLVSQPFPYTLPAATQHLVLWCSSPEAEMTDDGITAAIAREVDKLGGGEFVWYKNPKPSIVDHRMSHVQVFWRSPAQREPVNEALPQKTWLPGCPSFDASPQLAA